jgi:hypothetical protein
MNIFIKKELKLAKVSPIPLFGECKYLDSIDFLENVFSFVAFFVLLYTFLRFLIYSIY